MVDFFFHIDKYLAAIIQNFGTGSYILLFAIVFAETGLVVTPFLPGDSLLFAVGAFSAIGSFDLLLAFTVLSLAAIIGDSVNYAIGKYFGERLFRNEKSKIFKKEYLRRTHAFYEKYGGKTIVIARFVPVIRTFAPFVAGIGKMSYFRFFFYNVTGGFLWVASFLLCGYYFGNMPVIRDNFSLTIFVIIIISILPGIIEFYKHYRRKRAARRTHAAHKN